MDTAFLEKEINTYMGRLLRDKFGRGPGNVFSSVTEECIAIYITGFLSPMEKSLMDHQKIDYVQRTRDLLMENLKEEIQSQLEAYVETNINEIYYDWNLDGQTGMVLALISDCEPNMDNGKVSQKVNDVIDQVSIEAEKSPDEIYSIRIDERKLMVVRKGILISIERELISLGYEETLRIAKRNQEKRLVGKYVSQMEGYLHKGIADYFIDWNFDKDKSYMLFILK
ncbi:Na-translocating system protein MpsC family protein [Cytobacillus firmus]